MKIKIKKNLRRFILVVGCSLCITETPCQSEVKNISHQYVNNWIATATLKGTHHFLRKADGSLWTWEPGGKMEKVSFIDHVKEVVARDFTCMVLKQDGTVWVWGDIYNGQCGDPNIIAPKTDIPLKVPFVHNVRSISMTGQACYALLEDSTVVGWGKEWKVRWQRRTKMQGLTSIVSISGSIALKSDGTVWNWGINIHGELGDGTTESSITPVQVKDIHNAIAICQRNDGGLALLKDGTVWGWGRNYLSQLGDGKKPMTTGYIDQSYLPVQVKNIRNARAISAYSGTCFAILSDGTLIGWGDGRLAALSSLGKEANGNPVKIKGVPKGVIGIQSGIFHGFALLSDGTLMGWGSYMSTKIPYHEVETPILIASLGDQMPN